MFLLVSFEDCSILIFLCTYSLVSRKILPFCTLDQGEYHLNPPKNSGKSENTFLKVFTLLRHPSKLMSESFWIEIYDDTSNFSLLLSAQSHRFCDAAISIENTVYLILNQKCFYSFSSTSVDNKEAKSTLSNNSEKHFCHCNSTCNGLF